MEENQLNVPYIVYEGAQARQERTTKRLVIIIIILICMLFASNAMWLYAWNSYEYVEDGIDIDLDAGDGGNANLIGRDLNGVLNNGENQSEDTQNVED